MPGSGCENLFVLRGVAPAGNVSTSGVMGTQNMEIAMTRLRAGLLVVVVAALATGMATARVAWGGSVKGAVILKGGAPGPQKPPAHAHPDGGGKGKAPRGSAL